MAGSVRFTFNGDSHTFIRSCFPPLSAHILRLKERGFIMKKSAINSRVPRYPRLIVPTFIALKNLGGSGTNSEILGQIIKIMNISDDVVDIPHLGSTSMTELSYQAAWARTYLRSYGAIENSARSVWSITSSYSRSDLPDLKDILAAIKTSKSDSSDSESSVCAESSNKDNQKKTIVYPDDIKPWEVRLEELLQSMDPYGFERLAQRILRECGFSQVEVTKKSGDGGIDGTGKLKINGIFSFNVAFQCKRYKDLVGASVIRDFRGSLTTDIEKGVLITTGRFSKAARDEASNPGKQQIDLIDGEELIAKIAEFGIGVKPVTTYEIDEEFFANI